MFLFAVLPLLCTLGVVCQTGNQSRNNPCTTNLDSEFDFIQFHQEEGWMFSMLPDDEVYKDVEAQWLYSESTDNGDYLTTIKCLKGGQTQTLVEKELVHCDEDGLVTLNTEGEVYYMIVLKYVPEKYCFYCLCTPEGEVAGTNTTDYRFLLDLNNKVTEEDITEINAIEAKFGFRGPIRTLDTVPYLNYMST